MENDKTRHFIYLALLSAMAIVLSIIESVYIGPVFYMVRLGLANIIALITIRLMGAREMLIVNALRVFVSSLLRGMIFSSTFWISLGGTALSSLALILMDRQKASLMFSSIICSIMHTLGQVIVVSLFYMQAGMTAVLPYLLLGSIPMGILTGSIAQLVLNRIRPLQKHKI